MSLLYVLVGLLVAARLGELTYARRNRRRLLARGARDIPDPTYRWIVLLHGTYPVALLLEAHLAPWAHAQNPVWLLLGIAAAAEALRLWAIGTLGDRWNTRLLAIPGADPIAHGPYRWIPHPNYLAVAIELAALPLAFGLHATAALFTAANVVILAWRIPIEEEGLRDALEAQAPPAR